MLTEPAYDDDIAPLAFDPTDTELLLRQFAAAAWRRECDDAGVTLRMASIVLGKTREELIAMARGLGSRDFLAMLDHITEQQRRFVDLAAILDAVTARLLVAGEAACEPGCAITDAA